MKIKILLLIILVLTGCDKKNDLTAIKERLSIQKVWVFAQFNVALEKHDIETYYYYGKVSKDTYQLISQNKLTHGFILLEDVKYWGDNDLIKDYRNVENSGQLVFRIDDIRKIELINVEPKAGLGSEQFKEKSDVAAAGVKTAASSEDAAKLKSPTNK